MVLLLELGVVVLLVLGTVVPGYVVVVVVPG